MSNLIHTSIRLPAAPGEVWKFLSDGKKLAYWLLAHRANVSPEVGGKFEVYWVPDSADNSTEGCEVLAVAKNRLLTVQWKGPTTTRSYGFMNKEGSLTTVTFSLIPTTNGTELHVQHVGFRSSGKWPEARQFHEEAWGAWLKALHTAVKAVPTAKEMKERFSVLSELRLGAGELGDAELAAVSGGVRRRGRGRRPIKLKPNTSIKLFGSKTVEPGTVVDGQF